MPIRFRCSYCNRLLGIATRKAGTETTCPHCGNTITVPVPQAEGDGRTERINLDDVEEMLGTTATETAAKAAVAAAPPAAPPSPPPEPRVEEPKPAPHVVPKATPSQTPRARSASPVEKKPAPASTNPDDRPLFENDVDDILGLPSTAEEPEREKKAATTGMDAMSLSEPSHQIVISGQKATLLMILVVVLMGLSFAAGMFLAPHR